jgi:hypothetical protein
MLRANAIEMSAIGRTPNLSAAMIDFLLEWVETTDYIGSGTVRASNICRISRLYNHVVVSEIVIS